MKTIEEFYNKTREDQELQKAFAAAIEAGTAEAYLKEQGVSGTLQELDAYIKAQNRGGKIELSDDEMAAASGGAYYNPCGYDDKGNVTHWKHISGTIIHYNCKICGRILHQGSWGFLYCDPCNTYFSEFTCDAVVD